MTTPSNKSIKFTCDFSAVPHEILVEIVKYLKFEEQVLVSRVSSSWRKCLKEVDVKIHGGYRTTVQKLETFQLSHIIDTLFDPNRVLGMNSLKIKDYIFKYHNLVELRQLKYTNELPKTFLEKLCRNCPKITKIALFNAYETNMDPVWIAYPGLKEVTLKNDECDIEYDEISNESLKIWSDNCDGSLETLVIQGLSYHADHNGLLPLIQKCPKLKKVDLTYNYTIYDEIDHNMYSKEMLETLFSIGSLEKVRLTRKFYKKLPLDQGVKGSIQKRFKQKITEKHRDKIVFTKM